MANATTAERLTTTLLKTDRPRMQPPRRPTLRFTPWAWAKLLFLRDLGETEVGGFGISSESDLLLIEDIQMVRQRCTSVTVQFDDAAVADFFDEMVDRRLEKRISVGQSVGGRVLSSDQFANSLGGGKVPTGVLARLTVFGWMPPSVLISRVGYGVANRWVGGWLSS